jgi:hypothetical protein
MTHVRGGEIERTRRARETRGCRTVGVAETTRATGAGATELTCGDHEGWFA